MVRATWGTPLYPEFENSQYGWTRDRIHRRWNYSQDSLPFSAGRRYIYLEERRKFLSLDSIYSPDIEIEKDILENSPLSSIQSESYVTRDGHRPLSWEDFLLNLYSRKKKDAILNIEEALT